MTTTIEIKGKKIEFSRNWFTGSFTYTINGEKKILESVLNPFTHFSVNLSKTYEAKFEDISIIIVKTRPLLFAGFRAHKYDFFVNNELIKQVEEL